MDFLIQLTESILFWLFIAAIIAGVVDTIAGGGGLITVPSMLLAGLPPLTVLGTNRMQSAIGEFTACVNFLIKKQLNINGLITGVVATTIGAILGSYSISLFPNDFLKVMLPILMIAITIYTIFSKRMRDNVSINTNISTTTFMIISGLSIGFYNGFFGPGVGSIWMLAFVIFLGRTIKTASIAAKPLNLMGNIVSLIFFAALGTVNYKVGLVMGTGQIIGATVGSHLVINKGDKLVKPVFITVTVIMSLKLIYEELQDGSTLFNLFSSMAI
mgnify:CR=1 FL=1|jgi:uncharacterized membrane protein YfcA